MYNGLSLTDGYKFTHYKQYPVGTTKVYSYFESRGGEFPYTVFFGLQYYLKHYLEGRFVTREKLEEAKRFVDAYLGPDMINIKGWQHILDRYNGRLPLSIKAVPEGTVVPIRNILMSIENTDDEVPWLTNYLETLLVETWYPITVSTQSRVIKEDMLSFLEKTGDPLLISFGLHDFGFRGVSSPESAGIGGLAHLVNFLGTDTVLALWFGKEYYNAISPIAGFSVPAAEHSTITTHGQANEVHAYRNMLQQFPNGIVAVVSDSYDIYNACERIWGDILHDEVLARNGVVVIRPDSGNPVEVLSRIFEILGRKFPWTTNSKGYKVLDRHIRVIQGDGVNRHSIHNILQALMDQGWSADNICFGMGGALLQQLNRDTQQFAFKAAHAVVNSESVDVFKKPVTDSGKNSKTGYMKLVLDNSTYMTIPANSRPELPDQLVEVFRDGFSLQNYTLKEIRERAKIS